MFESENGIFFPFKKVGGDNRGWVGWPSCGFNAAEKTKHLNQKKLFIESIQSCRFLNLLWQEYGHRPLSLKILYIKFFSTLGF